MDGFDMFSIFLWGAILGVIPALIARHKGRSFGLWWVYGFAVFIIALVHSLVMENRSGMQCPACKEWIKQDSVVCKHCHTVIADWYREHQNDVEIPKVSKEDPNEIQCPVCQTWIYEGSSVCKNCHTVLADWYKEHSKNKEV